MRASAQLLACLVCLSSGCVIYLGEDGAGVRAWDAWDGPGWFDDQPRIDGSGVIVEEQRTLPEFDALSITGAFEVEVQAGGTELSVRLTGDDNVLPHLCTEVEGERLQVHFERGAGYHPSQRVRILVEVPLLEEVRLTGSSDVTLAGVHGERFEVVLAGSGAVIGSGAVEELKVRLSGSGTLDLSELAARTAELRSAGSGDIEVQVSDWLEASLAGSGSIRYTGDPDTELSSAGSGYIRRVR